MAKIDGVGEAKITADAKRLRQKDDQVKENTTKEKRSALFEWEDDGGAQRSDADGQTDTAREERDDLKQRLAGRVTRRTT
jgi:hypothetical protein